MKTQRCLSVVFGIGAAGVLALTSAGCAPKNEPEVHPVWPQPPVPARVLHLKNVNRASDLVKLNFFGKLAEAITGDEGVSYLRPHGIAVQEDLRLYVTDQERQAVIVFDLKSGKTTVIDRAGDTYFVSPVGVAACGDILAVSDSALREVYLMTPKGQLIRTLTKTGGFERPTGLAYDPSEKTVYVVDTLANEVYVFDLFTGRLMRQFGSQGTGSGELNFPTHVFVDNSRKVYVTDSLNFRVQVFDWEGKYLFHIGELGDASGYLAVPKGVGVDSYGHIYVVDSYFSAVQVFDREGTLLLAIGRPGGKSGEFQVPTGLAVDANNRVYVCDSYNGRVQIFEYIGETGDDRGDAVP